MVSFIADDRSWSAGRTSARVRCVVGDNPSPMTYTGTNTWIVSEPGSSSCLIIDPAPEGAHIDRVCAACEEEGCSVGAIAVTHGHFDHTEGAPELARRYSCPVYAPDVSLLSHLAIDDLRPLGEGPFAPFEGSPRMRVCTLPGHSSDSVALILLDEKAAFTGDVVFYHGPTVVFHPDGVLGDYLASLDSIDGWTREGLVNRLYPAHGRPVDDIARVVEATREHRLERLSQIDEAIIAGVSPEPEALYDVVYEGVDPRLKEASLRSIRAQLVYRGYGLEA